MESSSVVTQRHASPSPLIYIYSMSQKKMSFIYLNLNVSRQSALDSSTCRGSYVYTYMDFITTHVNRGMGETLFVASGVWELSGERVDSGMGETY